MHFKESAQLCLVVDLQSREEDPIEHHGRVCYVEGVCLLCVLQPSCLSYNLKVSLRALMIFSSGSDRSCLARPLTRD